MIICKNDDETKAQFDITEDEGFEWCTPLVLDADGYWDEEDGVKQVDEECPVCKELSDRTYNCTQYINDKSYEMEHCLWCGATWFELHTRQGGES